MPVTVTLQYSTGDTQDVVVAVNERVIEARVPLRGVLRGVDVNLDFQALARITQRD